MVEKHLQSRFLLLWKSHAACLNLSFNSNQDLKQSCSALLQGIFGGFFIESLLRLSPCSLARLKCGNLCVRGSGRTERGLRLAFIMVHCTEASGDYLGL